MKLNALLTDDDAVSPVIGVILMVAITVILAAVIGTFVLGLGNNIQQNAPQATFEVSSTSVANDANVTITHSTGDNIDDSELYVAGDLDDPTGTTPVNELAGTGNDDGEITAGDSFEAEPTNDSTATVRVVWQAGDGDNSATLQTFEIEVG